MCGASSEETFATSTITFLSDLFPSHFPSLTRAGQRFLPTGLGISCPTAGNPSLLPRRPCRLPWSRHFRPRIGNYIKGSTCPDCFPKPDLGACLRVPIHRPLSSSARLLGVCAQPVYSLFPPLATVYFFLTACSKPELSCLLTLAVACVDWVARNTAGKACLLMNVSQTEGKTNFA